MHLIMTSTSGMFVKENGKRTATAMPNTNGYINKLREICCRRDRVVFIAGDPHAYDVNDSIIRGAEESFLLSQMPFSQYVMIDHRNSHEVEKWISTADMVSIYGGHVPTQNRFLKELHLKEMLQAFSGVVLGQSAGSMNCASMVYCCPELEGEAINPEFDHFMDGLGLTETSILPHFNRLMDATLDGMRYVEDIVYKDSCHHPIVALADGSYIYSNCKTETLYGEAYLFKNKEYHKINDLGTKTVLSVK